MIEMRGHTITDSFEEVNLILCSLFVVCRTFNYLKCYLSSSVIPEYTNEYKEINI